MAVEVIDTLKPKNSGSFPVVEAEDVAVSDELRLPEALGQKAEQTDLEELSSALSAKADTSDVTTATANLQAQIDELITPVTQDAEVQNARVGVDGTSYQTLKARLDAENTALSESVMNIENNVPFNVKYDIYPNKRLLASNGTIAVNDGLISKITDYIPCSTGDVFNYKGLGSGSSASICFYNSLKEFISSALYNSELAYTDVTIPNGCAYIRVASYKFGSDGNAIILDLTKNQTKSFGVESELKAVQESVSDLNEESITLSESIAEIENNVPFNVKYDIYPNKRLLASNGTIAVNDGLISKITNYIPVVAEDAFKYKGLGSGTTASVCFYNSSKEFISSALYNSELTYTDVTVPNGCAYVRFASYKMGSDADTIIFDLAKNQINSFGVENELKETEETVSDLEILSRNIPLLIENANYSYKYEVYPNEKLVTTTGRIATNNGLTSKITDYIPCTPNMVFQYKGLGSGSIASVCFYNEEKVFISGDTYNSEVSFTNITIPANCKFVRFASMKMGEDVDPDTIIFDLKVDRGLVIGEEDNSKEKPLQGKKWIAVGDSLTSKYTLGTNVKNYTDYVSEELGLSVKNKGVAGSGYWKAHTQNLAFYQRVNDFTEDADIITIFGSFNDLGTEDGVGGITILGNIGDTGTSSICGCVNTTLDLLESKYPLAIIAIITPTPWSNSHDSNNCEMYVEKLKGIAEYRSIPCLDLYHSSSMRPWDETFRSNFYQNGTDGVHPNTEGHKRISPMFCNFITSILM